MAEIKNEGEESARIVGEQKRGDDLFDRSEANDWSSLEDFVTWSPWLRFLLIWGKIETGLGSDLWG